jgi:pre-mRNA-splicing factor CWC22
MSCTSKYWYNLANSCILSKYIFNMEGPLSDNTLSGRAGGIYIPPFKLAQMRAQITDKTSREYQKMMWELLRKSINGIINKVNISNLPNVIFELFNENLLRAKGVLVRAILKAQMAAPNFTHVYAALVAVINTKLPEIGDLLINRVILQFQRSFKRNDKLVCMATTKMIAHLVNQQVVHELLALEVSALLLEHPTEDSVEIACDFMIECGQVLTDISPQGVNAIFDRFRGILQEGEASKRVQYTIENLMAIRKTKFKDHPGVIQELDLVEDGDKITHEIELNSPLDSQESLNVFQLDPEWEKHEEEWAVIRKEIIGEDEYLGEEAEEEESEEEEDHNQNIIQDLTNRDQNTLRRTLYLTIMSSVDFEECSNKILKLNIREGQEREVCHMMVECCMNERSYLRFHGLLAQRFCLFNQIYQSTFQELFREYFAIIHRLETNKLRNVGKFFAHLLFTDSIGWEVLGCFKLSLEDTTSSSRIFIKIILQELAENLGIANLKERLNDPEMKEHFAGMFPRDTPQNVRFAINYYLAIGLDTLTDELRDFLEKMPQMVESSESSSESSDSASSSGDESSSESSSSSRTSSEERIQQAKNIEAADRFLRRELESTRRHNERVRSRSRERHGSRKSPPRYERRRRSRSNERSYRHDSRPRRGSRA